MADHMLVVMQVAGQLFGVTVEAADGKAPVWNSDVRFFCIKQDAKPKAYFFFVSFPLCVSAFYWYAQCQRFVFVSSLMCAGRTSCSMFWKLYLRRSLSSCPIYRAGIERYIIRQHSSAFSLQLVSFIKQNMMQHAQS